MKYDYIKIRDIVDHLLRRFRFDHWIPEGDWFDVSEHHTKREYENPSNWASIGIHENSEQISQFRPIWDVFAPDEETLLVVKGRLRYACLRLGGRFAEHYKGVDKNDADCGPERMKCDPLADTDIFMPEDEERTPSKDLTDEES